MGVCWGFLAFGFAWVLTMTHRYTVNVIHVYRGNIVYTTREIFPVGAREQHRHPMFAMIDSSQIIDK